jgi:hypothetical protein
MLWLVSVGFYHRSGDRRVLGHFYNMKNQFWAGLGSRAVLVKKKFGADYEQLLSIVFSCFHGQKINSIFF